VRPPEAGKPRAACESPSPLQSATADGGGKGGQARHTGTAGKASAEFRTRYPIPLRRTSGSFIILEQLRDGKRVKNIFPKIGGRLRLAHEQNQQISITTEIIRYDESVAVVKSVTTTMKGSFPGLGMASMERDSSIAPAILELAETHGIAGSLKFDGAFTFH
jgi:hypothetical protein